MDHSWDPNTSTPVPEETPWGGFAFPASIVRWECYVRPTGMSPQAKGNAQHEVQLVSAFHVGHCLLLGVACHLGGHGIPEPYSLGKRILPMGFFGDGGHGMLFLMWSSIVQLHSSRIRFEEHAGGVGILF